MDRREDRKLALERQMKPQHLAFVRRLIEGDTMRGAYKSAFRCESENTASTNSARLYGTNTLVREYYSLCTGMAADAALTTREQIIQRLLEIGDADDARAQGAAVAALKEVLGQLGSTHPTRIEVSGPDGKPVQQEVRSKGLQTETVIDLASKLFGIDPEKAAAMFSKGKVESDEDA